MRQFSLELCFTLRPGFSFVLAADFDMFRAFRSSITTIARFLLIAVLLVWRKSWRIWAILRCTEAGFAQFGLGAKYRRLGFDQAALDTSQTIVGGACAQFEARLVEMDGERDPTSSG